MYRVIRYFTDLQDKKHPYHVGDIFPHEGTEVTEERYKELSGINNRQGVPLIEYVGDEIPMQANEILKKRQADNIQNKGSMAVAVQGENSVSAKKSSVRKAGSKSSAKK